MGFLSSRFRVRIYTFLVQKVDNRRDHFGWWLQALFSGHNCRNASRLASQDWTGSIVQTETRPPDRTRWTPGGTTDST